MKKAFIFLTIVLFTIGSVFAQSRDGRGNRAIPEQVKIEGTLQLHNGQFAVASGSNIYYVPMIRRYVGFIEGLKEGAAASFEGYVRGNFLHPVKMTVGGKTYELSDRGDARDSGKRKDAFGNRGHRGFGKGFGPGGFNNRGYGWNRCRR